MYVNLIVKVVFSYDIYICFYCKFVSQSNLTSEINQGPGLTNRNIHLIHEMHFIDGNAELLTIQIQADF